MTQGKEQTESNQSKRQNEQAINNVKHKFREKEQTTQNKKKRKTCIYGDQRKKDEVEQRNRKNKI